jgi:hypothetical protein
MPVTTFKPELLGARFADHEVPLEVLKDFAAFEEMLIEVAKREYLAAHPGRARIPRGFTKGVEVRLAAIEEGSAILSLVLAGLSLTNDASVYMTRAHDKIVSTIANVERGELPELPPELLRYFDRFGRSLLDGESIRFQRTDGEKISLTPEGREKLLRASEAEEWTEEKLIKGRVSGADVADAYFVLKLTDGTKLKAPLEQQHRATVLDAMGQYEKNRIVAVKGIVRIDRNGHPKSVDSVEHMTILDPLDIETRLEELAALKDRWLNGKGVALDETGLKALSERFEENFSSDLPLPYLYPTPEGAILAEWTLEPWAVSLEITIPSQTAQYQALNLASDESTDLELDLSDVGGWTTLNQALKDLNSPTIAE